MLICQVVIIVRYCNVPNATKMPSKNSPAGGGLAEAANYPPPIKQTLHLYSWGHHAQVFQLPRKWGSTTQLLRRHYKDTARVAHRKNDMLLHKLINPYTANTLNCQ